MLQDLFISDDEQGMGYYMKDVVDILQNSNSNVSNADLRILRQYQAEVKAKDILKGRKKIDQQDDEKGLNINFIMK